MLRLLLVRHATAGHLGRTLAGRAPGVRLDDAGRAEARTLADGLSDLPVAAVYTSPLERTRQTARPIAAARGLEARVAEAFVEVDFGDWTGLALADLEGREDWRRWNEHRGTARAPGGEGMGDVLARALAGVHALAGEHENQTVVVVTHCDVIRPLLAHFLGFPIDNFHRLRIDTASVSVVEVHDWGGVVVGVNWRAAGLST